MEQQRPATQDEREVLAFLAKDARQSIEALAAATGLSALKVGRIVARLEKRRAIWGYSVVADDDACERAHYYLLLKRSAEPIDDRLMAGLTKAQLDALVPGQEVTVETVECVHGLFDVMVSLWAADLPTASRFRERFLQRFSQAFSEAIILETIVTLCRHGQENPFLAEKLDIFRPL